MVAFHKDKKGTLERHEDGRYLLHRATLGYVTRTGGYSSKRRNVLRFEGAGEAIRYAAVHGFAIVRWF